MTNKEKSQRKDRERERERKKNKITNKYNVYLKYLIFNNEISVAV
jgi:hypothetical protein